VITLKRGYDLPHQQRRPGAFPIVSSAGITGHHAEAKVQGPGVITGRYGTLGEVFFVESDFWPLNTALYVRDFKGNDPRFVSYFLRLLNFGTQNAAGAVPGVNRNHLHAIGVRVPPLNVQRRIAGILSAYDDLIENCERRIRVLDEMARALYREWFVLFRYPGHEKTPLVESPLGRIPKGWRVERAGGIMCETRRGVPKGTLEDGPTRYVGLEHIPRRSLALNAWEETEELGSNKLRFEPGEVLFGKIRPYFHKVSVAPFAGVCSADTFVISASEPTLRAFMTCLVSSDEFVAHASATANGSKMPRANWDVMMNFPVVLPPPSILESFSALVEPWIACQQSLVSRVHNLRKTRDLLLPRLLSGQHSMVEKAA
jgi:type I restriction enzyme S subunit